MKRLLHLIPVHIRFIASVYASGICFFTIFRLFLLLGNYEATTSIPQAFSVILSSFAMGLRFDTVVSGYLLAIPLVLLSAFAIFGRLSNLVLKSVTWFTGIVYALAFFISAADIPFYNHFSARLNVSVFSWAEHPEFMFGMVLGEPEYYGYIFLFIIIILLFFKVLWSLYNTTVKDTSISNYSSKRLLFLSLIACFIMFAGIRGRLSIKSPIRVGTAWFSDYPFANHLGLNPVFTLARSIIDARKPINRVVTLKPDNEAVEFVKASFSIKTNEEFYSPLARIENEGGISKHKNIVLIIMESMSAQKMARYGNTDSLTPFLDSLASVSVCFDSIYTAGTHTFNGIYSTLYSYPALFRQHPMANSVNFKEYSSIPMQLAKAGYSNIFFTNHDAQFDNMEGFLKMNGFQSIVSQKDYPSEKVHSSLGVPDDFMFEFAVNRMRSVASPFFCTLMTSSDHGPYYIPDDIPFKPRHNDIHKGIVEYADWSLSKFIQMARNEKWYNNTLFVFVADHGANMGSTHLDIPLSYHHTPFLIFDPSADVRPLVSGARGGQIDVMPTVMSSLNFKYINNSLGTNLLEKGRPCIYFCSDDILACLDGEFIYIRHSDGREGLFDIMKNRGNLQSESPERFEFLKQYALSHTQTAQWMILSGNTKEKNKTE